jgi:ribosome-binding factor A
MPDIAFVIDDSYEKLARLDAILKKEAHDRED